MFALLRNLAPYRGCPIAIDLGATRLRLAQVDRAPDGELSLIAAAACDVPADVFDSPKGLGGFLTRTLKKMIGTGGFKGRNAVLAIPSPLLFIRHFRMPRLDEEQTRQQLQGEIAGKIPLDPTQCALRHVIAGDVYGDGSGGQQEVILFAASQQAVQTLLDATAAAKLEVAGLQVGARAIVDCFGHVYRRRTDAEAIDLFVDLGANTVRAIVAREKAIRFARSISIPSSSLKDDASIARLVDELELCRRYYESTFPDKPVSRVIFVGGGARDGNRCHAIAQMLGLPAQVGDPLVRFKADALANPSAIDRRDANPDWAVPLGLSMGPVHSALSASSSSVNGVAA